MSAPLVDAALHAANQMQAAGTASPAFAEQHARLLACLTELRAIEIAYAELVADADVGNALLDRDNHLATGGCQH